MPDTKLSASDLRRVLSTVLELNKCTTITGFSHDGVPALLELIPAQVFNMELLRPNGDPAIKITAPGWPYTRDQVAYYQKHATKHPILAHFMRHGIGKAMRICDVVSQNEFERNPIYLNCMKPHGLRFTLAILVEAAPHRQMGLSYDRKDRDFTKREITLLETLSPHLASLLIRLELHTGGKRPWSEPTTRDWLAGDLGVSNREAELLLLLVEGLSNQEIAKQLDLAQSTVKKHFENAFRKLGVSNRMAAVKLVREQLG